MAKRTNSRTSNGRAIGLKVLGQGREPLTLKAPHLRKRLVGLFDEMDQDRALTKQFVNNPTRVLARRVYRERIGAQRESETNRLLYSMLASNRFRKWLETYARKARGKKVTREEFASDFATAMVRYGDKNILLSVLRNASEGYGLPGWGNVMQQLVTGPEKHVFTSPATPSSSTQKTESSTNFNHKHDSTSSGFDPGSVINPAVMRAVTEQLVARAKQLASTGKLANPAARIGS